MALTKVNEKRRASGLLDNVRTIIWAALIAVVIRTFLFEPFNIPSGSMIPTLLVGDYIFVEKYAYGYSHYSLPFAPDLFSGRIFGSLPHRGDIVVFRYPRDTSVDYIKRVIGLPGDTVQVINGELYLNGKEVPRKPEGAYLTDEGGIPVEAGLFQEDLPARNGHAVRHDILKLTDEGYANNTPAFKVPPHELFVMGDNRDNSEDSRFWGYVPEENLVGRAEITFFSVNPRYPWWEFWMWPVEVRWTRIGHILS